MQEHVVATGSDSANVGSANAGSASNSSSMRRVPAGWGTLNMFNSLLNGVVGSAASSRVAGVGGTGSEATGALGIGVTRLGQAHGQLAVPVGDPRLRQQQTTMRSAGVFTSAAIGGLTAGPLQGILRRSDGSSGSGPDKMKVSFRDVNGGTLGDVREIARRGED
jgi:hypothetical protein